MVEPTINSAGFGYEEGEGLEADEIADMAVKLAKPMRELPGEGLKDGVCAEIGDQMQVLNFQLIIKHQVRYCGARVGMICSQLAATACCIGLDSGEGPSRCNRIPLDSGLAASQHCIFIPLMTARTAFERVFQSTLSGSSCTHSSRMTDNLVAEPEADLQVQAEWDEEQHPNHYILSGSKPEAAAGMQAHSSLGTSAPCPSASFSLVWAQPPSLSQSTASS